MGANVKNYRMFVEYMTVNSCTTTRDFVPIILFVRLEYHCGRLLENPGHTLEREQRCGTA